MHPSDSPTDRPPLTYAEVGATASVLPAGYHHGRYRRTVGHGPQAFERAADALMSWQVHRRAGLRIGADTAPAAVGVDVRMTLGAGRLGIVIPCRVVYVVGDGPAAGGPGRDRPIRRGFAYGTLPGHPETGEESFVVELSDDDSVTFEMVVFSSPARWYMRVAGPLARLVQALALRRYGWACARFARSS